MREWLARSQVRQRPMLAVYAGLLILIALMVGIISLLWLLSPSSDRLTVIANLLSLGTLLLALVAGVVALAAYTAATGLPSLRLKFLQPSTNANWIFFAGGNDGVAAGDANIVRIIVENTTSYAARTPAVIIEFRGCAIQRGMYGALRDWTPTQRDPRTGDVQAIQWDGGPNYAIHGNSTRHLPEINMQGLDPYPGGGVGRPMRMIVKLLADGYSRPPVVLNINFLGKDLTGPAEWADGEWL